ncbi:MAG: type II toxin-antitoxin system death-on-curing family toxin [Solirubrobacteraceae bacterium]
MTEPPVDYLSVEDLVEIAVGVLDEVEIRDRGLLASAAGRPQSSAFGADAYPTFAAKAAALMHSLARNHALVDGNKRLAWAATRVFCLLNGRDLTYSVDEAETVVVAVATGELDVPDLAKAIELHLPTARGCDHVRATES